ncbi:MAG TPA: DoxX family membrane protein [Mycobacteriales bacterium]|nr:DoxX family membrane protein [Mycobacteriales bacterium]
MRLSHIPLRLTTGAFLLSSGLNDLHTPPEAVAEVQKRAKEAFPQLPDVPPAVFGKGLAAGELALGAALLLPFVSPVAAGAALTAFSGALLKMWWVTPGMHEEGLPRPTPEGTSAAKDVCLLGAGTALVLDGLSDGARHTARRTRKATRQKTKAVREALPLG